MTIIEYISSIKKRYQTGISREHAYRGDLQQLLETMLPDTIVTNEPARIDCGSPDYVITRKDIPIGYIEAKDIGIDLGKTLKSDQLKRYMASLDNLILTDYMRFVFIKDGEVYETIDLFELSDGLFSDKTVEEQDRRYAKFEALIKDFAEFITQTIKNPTKLASMMANKAKLLAQVINRALTSDVESNANSSLKEQMEAFKLILIHDIKPSEFADIYAQTIAYGMFAARLHDPTPDTFSRQEAASLIPKSNPFLRKLFQYISGYDIDERIEWIVSALADIFRATDVAAILKDFGKATQMNDPFIHFYEYFLAEYDPKLRKARGVWYTPEPVVNFIVRAVDDILKSEFGLPKGLADNSKTEIEVETDIFNKKKQKYEKLKKQVHRVQILDPATGTGTFLAEVVKHIYSTKFKNMQGAWPQYVENDLIPRLNGFEILMASYAMAHLKLDLLLGETGYKATKDQRFRIYLTNSLEEANPDTGTLFANWLSSEASEANAIKRDTPVMCVIGNPPYSISSSNKSDWIENLMLDFKKNLNERNIQPLSDDYLKFMKLGQTLIDNNGEGLLAFISNNSFVDGLIHKQVRSSLAGSFTSIYIINLHGNSTIGEKCPDGSKDENVFDIKQGVSINIFVKNSKKKKCKIRYYDLYGKRSNKYEFLFKNSISSIEFQEITSNERTNNFHPIDHKLYQKYSELIDMSELFQEYSSGVQTEFDALAIQNSYKESEQLLEDLKILDKAELMIKYHLDNKSGKKIDRALDDVKNNVATITPIHYRPFDKRSVIYTGKSNGLMGRPRGNFMKHMLNCENECLIVKRGRLLGGQKVFNHCFISNTIIDKNFLADQSYCFPALMSVENDLLNQKNNSKSNFSTELISEIQKKLNVDIEPIDFLHYIYACLNSHQYRVMFADFLSKDFPRIPFPKNIDSYTKLVKLGKSLKNLHSLNLKIEDHHVVQFPKHGDNCIVRKMSKSSIGFEVIDDGLGKIWINDEQYFDNVPELAWDFYIGGYQPAQKWLKDRQGRTLTYDDIEHYQKIIAALVETDNIMKEIDEVGVV